MNNNTIQQILQIMAEIKKSGKTAEQYFYDKAKEMGVNPEEIVKTLQSLNK